MVYPYFWKRPICLMLINLIYDTAIPSIYHGWNGVSHIPWRDTTIQFPPWVDNNCFLEPETNPIFEDIWRDTPPSSLTWQAGKSSIFNRRYIFKYLVVFFIVMLIFRNITGVGPGDECNWYEFIIRYAFAGGLQPHGRSLCKWRSFQWSKQHPFFPASGPGIFAAKIRKTVGENTRTHDRFSQVVTGGH